MKGKINTIRSVPYFGGKFYQSKTIINLIPDKHKIYVEPFGGAAWVLVKKPKSKIEIYNDINKTMYNFWLTIINEPMYTRLISLLNKTPFHANWIELLNTVENNNDPVIDAYKTICFSYLLRSGTGTTLKSNPKLCNFSRTKIRSKTSQMFSFIEQIEKLKERFRNVIIENLDYKEIINFYSTDETIFYIDSPYYIGENSKRVGSHKYNFEFTKKDHEEMAEIIQKNSIDNKSKFIISYYNDEYIIDLYKGWNIIEYDAVKFSGHSSNKNNKKKVKEILIYNFENK